MNVDVEIYLNGVIKFFKSNPKDLFTLIREVSLINLDKGDDVSLTQKQILEICLILNGKDPNTPKIKPADNYIFETKFGTIFLN
jgi:hypothetical protein